MEWKREREKWLEQHPSVGEECGHGQETGWLLVRALAPFTHWLQGTQEYMEGDGCNAGGNTCWGVK